MAYNTLPQDLGIDQISVGQRSVFEKTWTKEDVSDFARLSGDANPLHLEDSYASKTKFGRPIVHGMLVASSFSALVGMYLPGKRCLYLQQTLTFTNPVFVGDLLLVEGEVESVSASVGIITLSTIIRNSAGQIAISGIAKVRVLPGVQ